MARTLSARAGTALALLAAAALAAGANAADAKVYFTAFPALGGTAVERAGFEGAQLETLQAEPIGFDDGIALDVQAGRMYWTDTAASVIRSANLNGSEAQILIDDFGWEPLGIAIDPVEHKLYWNDRQGIKRADLDGSEEELLSKGVAGGFIALDPSARRMYWTSGTNIKTAAMEPSPVVSDLVSGQSSPFGLAVDPLAGRLYWLELKKNAIRRSNLDGSEVRTLLERPGAGFEGGLAIDSAAGRLYWTEAATHAIGTSNLDGGEARTLFATGLDSPVGIAVESTDPVPSATSPPSVEGSAQVGGTLACNPGTWTGTGPITFSYRWTDLVAGVLEGVAGPLYVPSSEQAGATLACVVSATDDVATTTATSAGVPIAPLSPPPAPISLPRLLAGFALASIRGHRMRVRIPVFSTRACPATLRARALAPRARRAGAHRAPVLLAARTLPVGRSGITLRGLRRATTYRLTLTVACGDGQHAHDVAVLRVARR